MQYVLSTGNLCSKDVHDHLKTLAPSVHVVRGDFDDVRPVPSLGRPFRGALQDPPPKAFRPFPRPSDDVQDVSLPETAVVTVQSVRIGIMHGHQVVPWGDVDALSAVQRQLDVDVLITGHTHTSHILEYDGRLLLNPGSITGAFSATASDTIPSFMVLAINDRRVRVYNYELRDGELAFMESVHVVPGAGGATSSSGGAGGGGGVRAGAASSAAGSSFGGRSVREGDL